MTGGLSDCHQDTFRLNGFLYKKTGSKACPTFCLVELVGIFRRSRRTPLENSSGGTGGLSDCHQDTFHLNILLYKKTGSKACPTFCLVELVGIEPAAS